MDYPKVEYYCEESIFEFNAGPARVRLWFDANKTDCKHVDDVKPLAVNLLEEVSGGLLYNYIDENYVGYARLLANAYKPRGLNAVSVQGRSQDMPAHMIYTTPFQEGESAHG